MHPPADERTPLTLIIQRLMDADLLLPDEGSALLAEGRKDTTLMIRTTSRAMFSVLVLLALLAAASGAQAQDFYPNDATISTDLGRVNVVVGYANNNDYFSGNGTSPTVNLVSPGRIGWNMYTYNSSIVNLSGGSVVALETFESSTANVSGGSILDPLYAFSNSTVNMSGGSVGGHLEVSSSGILNLYGMGLSTTLVNSDNGGFSVYALSGHLLDGTDIAGRILNVQNGTGANVHFYNSALAPSEGTLTRNPGGTLTCQFWITNPSPTQTANTVTLTTATLGGVTTTTPLPHHAFNIKPGASKQAVLHFKGVAAGTAVLCVSGTTSLGPFYLFQVVNVP